MTLINLSPESLTTIADALEIARREYQSQIQRFAHSAGNASIPEHYRKADADEIEKRRNKINEIDSAITIIQQLTDAADAVDAVLRQSDR